MRLCGVSGIHFLRHGEQIILLFFITGKKEMRNATEIAFPIEQMKLIEGVDSSEKAADILTAFNPGVSYASGRLLRQLKIEEIINGCADLGDGQVIQIVRKLLALVNGSMNMVDLSLAGGSKFAGCIQPNYTKLLNDPGSTVVFIDQSATGMFERRTRVGL